MRQNEKKINQGTNQIEWGGGNIQCIYPKCTTYNVLIVAQTAIVSCIGKTKSAIFYTRGMWLHVVPLLEKERLFWREKVGTSHATAVLLRNPRATHHRVFSTRTSRLLVWGGKAMCLRLAEDAARIQLELPPTFTICHRLQLWFPIKNIWIKAGRSSFILRLSSTRCPSDEDNILFVILSFYDECQIFYSKQIDRLFETTHKLG